MNEKGRDNIIFALEVLLYAPLLMMFVMIIPIILYRIVSYLVTGIDPNTICKIITSIYNNFFGYYQNNCPSISTPFIGLNNIVNDSISSYDSIIFMPIAAVTYYFIGKIVFNILVSMIPPAKPSS